MCFEKKAGDVYRISKQSTKMDGVRAQVSVPHKIDSQPPCKKMDREGAGTKGEVPRDQEGLGGEAKGMQTCVLE